MHENNSDVLVNGIAERLRRERERVQLSASELARRAGIAKSTLTQLEAGRGNPGVETLWALAVALGLPFAELITPPAPDVQVVRADQGVATHAEHSDFTATLLATCPPGPRHNIYRLELGAGSSRYAAAHIPGTIEHLTVLQGQLSAGPRHSPTRLAPGDYMRFPGDIDHVYGAGPQDAVALLIMAYP